MCVFFLSCIETNIISIEKICFFFRSWIIFLLFSFCKSSIFQDLCYTRPKQKNRDEHYKNRFRVLVSMIYAIKVFIYFRSHDILYTIIINIIWETKWKKWRDKGDTKEKHNTCTKVDIKVLWNMQNTIHKQLLNSNEGCIYESVFFAVRILFLSLYFYLHSLSFYFVTQATTNI